MLQYNLTEFGLSEGEGEIYLALLKRGPANVMMLAKDTGRHRTHIYDTIEKLKEKGLVSESVIDNKKVIIASDPENIIDLLKEKEEQAHEIIPDLKKLQKLAEKEILVETFKGIFGLKSVLRDILREKKDYVGYGEGTRFEQVLPVFFQQFRKESERQKICLKLVLKKGAKIPRRVGLQIRYLNYLSPSTTFIYADKVAIIIWEPHPTAIRIKDKTVAESYKGHFEILWRDAKTEKD